MTNLMRLLKPQWLFLIPALLGFLGFIFVLFRKRADFIPMVWAVSIGFFLSIGWKAVFVLIPESLAGFALLVILPFVCSALVASSYCLCCKRRELEPSKLQGMLVLPYAQTILSAIIFVGFLWEGWVCILMALPLLALVYFAGAACGYFLTTKLVKSKDMNKMQVSTAFILLWFLPLIIQYVDTSFFVQSELYSVSSERIIEADLDTVWPQVKAYTQLPEELPVLNLFDNFFALGLPRPEYATIECDHVGCNRQCVFNQNVVFDETITEIIPNKVLTFDVTPIVGPQDPITGIDLHILPGGAYFTSVKGQYRLESIGENKVRLSGTSWYKLNSSINWYYKWWSERIIQSIHQQVFAHIQRTVEG